MEQLNNLALLILALNIAWLITNLIKWSEEFIIRYQINRNKNNMLYKKRFEKLHNNAFDYYYTLAINDPFKLSYELASKEMKRVKEEGKVFEFYSKLKGV